MKHAVIRFSSLGDCVLVSHLVSALRAAGSEEIRIVTRERYAELFAAMRGVDGVICLGDAAGPRTLFRIGRYLRKQGYAVIDSHNNLRSFLLALGLRKRPPALGKYYLERTSLILFKHRRSIPTMVERLVELAGPIENREEAPPPRDTLAIPDRIREKTRRIIGNGGNWVALAPGSRWPAKRWGSTKYLELATRIVGRFGLRVLVVGSSEDREDAADFGRFGREELVDLRGETSILEAASLLSGVRALVTNDSGLLHLAEAVGTPVLAIFGPTVDRFGYYPLLAESKACERNLPCRPCSRNGSRRCPLGTNECMSGIATDAVEEIFRDLLEGRGPRRYVLP